jgi:hypothetical protein
MLKIHEELCLGENEFSTHRFCAPIFIAGEFELLLGDPLARNQQPDTAKLRNGTLTFVSVNGGVYGITCRHVIEELERRQNDQKLEGKNKYGFETPEQVLAKIYIPQGNQHIHVNSKFHIIPGDDFTGEQVDIAIAKINPSILKAIGRFAIPASKVGRPTSTDIPGLCGIATGCPEANRETSPQNELLNNFHISTLYAVAEFSCLDKKRVNLCGELSETPKGDNLSGMSGGPIFWSHETDWGLAGIIFNGRDLVGSEKSRSQSMFSKPAIWIDGETVEVSTLEYWVSLIPPDEKFLYDGSKMLYMPEAFRRRAV